MRKSHLDSVKCYRLHVRKSDGHAFVNDVSARCFGCFCQDSHTMSLSDVSLQRVYACYVYSLQGFRVCVILDP